MDMVAKKAKPKRVVVRKSKEEQIYDAQEKEIRKYCGKKAAKMANYGWGVDDLGKNLTVSTKVYGFGILTSYFSKKEIIHDWGE